MAKTMADHQALAEQVLPLAQKALAERRIEIAVKLSEVALAEARKARNPELLRRAHGVENDSKQALTEFGQYEAAKAELQQEPGNAEANLTAGCYECLVLGDWDQGLRKLAAGSDESLRELAKKDLAAPEDVDAQEAVGDGWWELAEVESGVHRANLYARAGWWYEKALPRAPGSLRKKLQARLDKITRTSKTP
jgi:hypothetical protein